MGGAIFEGLVISDVWKTFLNRGKEPAAFFWRSQAGLEVDLIIQTGGKLWPIEIKLTSTPSLNHLKALNRFKEMAGDEAAESGILVCNVDEIRDMPGKNMALPWFAVSDWLNEIMA